jgi:uncharacterized protein YcfJ
MRKGIVSLLISIFLITGCATKTGTGALAGVGIGAAAGGLIGGGEGALIGGAIGALGGGLVGSALDEQDRQIMERTSPSTVNKMDRSEPLTINDIIKLSQGGVSDNSIIRYINDTNTSYSLSRSQVRRLQQAGVSQKIINYMIDTGE